jgi:hypothetical protein
MMLIFGTDGKCIKEIGGAAIPDAGTAYARPSALAGVPIDQLTIVSGVVMRDSAAQAAAEASAMTLAEQSDTLGKIVSVFLNHENRLRALEAKAPVTKAQLMTAIKAM